MVDALTQYPELSSWLDDSDSYRLSASEFQADDQRWLLVTQSGPDAGGQLLFRITPEGLQPAGADTVINLNPESRGLEGARAPLPLYQPSAPGDHAAMATAMVDSVGTFSTASGPDGGNLACVWAVRHLARRVLGRWLTRTDSTAIFAAELENGFRRSFAEAETDTGGIVISPTRWIGGRVRHGHVGLLGPRPGSGDRLIYSNSSERKRWEQNYTLSRWRSRYEGVGLRTLFFPLPAPAPVQRVADESAFAPAALLDRLEAGDPAQGPQPDPLAGEGVPEPGVLVLGEERTRGDAGLPISHAQALKATRFLKEHFGAAMKTAVAGTPFTVDHLCAIACKETAIFWVGLIDALPAREIVERCVFDASGDYPGTSRRAFPVNADAFRAVYGDAFADMLIDEANKTRRLRHYAPRAWLYKGYGLFQYDLQHVKTDEAFFRERQWYDFGRCLEKVMKELKEKHAATGDLWRAVRAYNGSGPKATQYANHVMRFVEWCATVTL